MQSKLAILLVTLVTVLLNIGFLMTGVTHTVTCSVANTAAAAYAAFLPLNNE